MRKLIKITCAAIAFVFLATGVDQATAQNRNKEARKEYKREVKEARREYKNDIRDGDSRRGARREYRNEVREARREYREDRRYNQTYNRPPYGRANGYYNVRPYRGVRRGAYRGRLPQNRYYVPRARRWR